MSQKEKQKMGAIQELDPLQKRVIAILSGEEKPPNETIAYIVRRATGAREEIKAHMDRIRLLDEELKDRRTRVIELRGAAQNYADDVKHWLQETKIVTPEPARIVTP